MYFFSTFFACGYYLIVPSHYKPKLYNPLLFLHTFWIFLQSSAGTSKLTKFPSVPKDLNNTSKDNNIEKVRNENDPTSIVI
ncbi:unnamed protein product [Ceutorhynchus assimilis]|uniref:Uncharacterized protein n=1 Tax=Ceutorhynchus assimilis TaxID=467358 RepID=A0A9N9MLC3_9CUCU|nr:unnamed protein product [Ceutorhynchus assimilis]